jgi:DNA-binding response OmpR family regulator
LCTALEPLGYRIDVAPTGAQAIIRAATAHFDLVLVDVMLDDGLGTDLIEPLKKQSMPRPVIVLTGVPADEEIVLECRRKGAFAYVSKSAAIEDLLRQIRRALGT